jgi:lipoate---protein ligase
MDDGIQAFAEEDDLLKGEGPRVRVYTVDYPQVVLGRGSRPERELNLESCRADGVALRRRRGGGCAVVLDPGNVLVAAAVDAPGIGDNQRHFDRLCRWLIAGVAAVGVPGITQAGISDLALGDRKVAGCCIYRRPGRLLFSAALLVDPDLSLLDRYLRHPPREPAYRRRRAHGDFVVRLGDVSSAPPPAEFGAALAVSLGIPALQGV